MLNDDLENDPLVRSVLHTVKALFQGEGTGHDWWHIHRVLNMSLHLSSAEGANLRIAALGALLHDIADHKFHGGDLTKGPEVAEAVLRTNGADAETTKHVVAIVNEVTFKGAHVATPVSSKEAACVQDADRLDAIGAIGIARAFAYGGAKHRPLHDPEQAPETHSSFEAYATSIGATTSHFYEKLLLLRDRMNTDEGRRIATERHDFMLLYLEQFFKEWNINQ